MAACPGALITSRHRDRGPYRAPEAVLSKLLNDVCSVCWHWLSGEMPGSVQPSDPIWAAWGQKQLGLRTRAFTLQGNHFTSCNVNVM